MWTYGLDTQFIAQPGARDELAAILDRAAQLMQTAPGCVRDAVHVDVIEADSVWVTEEWDSRAAHDASLTLTGVGALVARARPLIARMGMRVEKDRPRSAG